MSETLEAIVCIELIVQEDDKEHLDIVGDGVQRLKLHSSVTRDVRDTCSQRCVQDVVKMWFPCVQKLDPILFLSCYRCN